MTDNDVRAIRSGLERLRAAPIEPGDYCGQYHGYRLNPPLSEEEIRWFEIEHRIVLPADYRGFLTKVGNGGAGPAYGVFKLGEAGFSYWDHNPWYEDDGEVGSPGRPFQFTKSWNEVDDPNYEGLRIDGAIPLCTWGCAQYGWLVVTGPEAGTVWADCRADYAGIEPLTLPDAPRVSFLRWYRDWLEQKVAALDRGPDQSPG